MASGKIKQAFEISPQTISKRKEPVAFRKKLAIPSKPIAFPPG
jgi:hypothetical protein